MSKRNKPWWEDERSKKISYKDIKYSSSPGTISNAIITARNGGIKHQFLDDIGGCSANYR